jgi:outer membrane protein W
MLVGDMIKTSAADSSAACAVVCQNTPGCTAATYFENQRGTQLACATMRKANTATTGLKGASALVKTD